MSAFPNRKEELFGRNEDLIHLLDRAEAKGLTAVCPRAQMGKT